MQTRGASRPSASAVLEDGDDKFVEASLTRTKRRSRRHRRVKSDPGLNVKAEENVDDYADYVLMRLGDIQAFSFPDAPDLSSGSDLRLREDDAEWDRDEEERLTHALPSMTSASPDWIRGNKVSWSTTPNGGSLVALPSSSLFAGQTMYQDKSDISTNDTVGDGSSKLRSHRRSISAPDPAPFGSGIQSNVQANVSPTVHLDVDFENHQDTGSVMKGESKAALNFERGFVGSFDAQMTPPNGVAHPSSPDGYRAPMAHPGQFAYGPVAMASQPMYLPGPTTLGPGMPIHPLFRPIMPTRPPSPKRFKNGPSRNDTFGDSSQNKNGGGSGKYRCGRCGQVKLNHVCAFEVTTACRHVAAQTDPDGVVQRKMEEPMKTVQLRDDWGLVPECPPTFNTLPSMDAKQYSVERVISPRQSSTPADKAQKAEHKGSIPADKPRKGSNSTSQTKDSDESTDSDDMVDSSREASPCASAIET